MVSNPYEGFAQAQNLPPKPDRYVTDQAGVLDASTLSAINAQLEQVEKETSNQIVVAIYPSLPPDVEIAQYATDTYNAWGVGQKGKDNGALLMVFFKDHKMFIATGRGLEGALPDAICKNIITQVIAPQFKQGNYSGGIQAGVNAMIAATGDKGNGHANSSRMKGSVLSGAKIIRLHLSPFSFSCFFQAKKMPGSTANRRPSFFMCSTVRARSPRRIFAPRVRSASRIRERSEAFSPFSSRR